MKYIGHPALIYTLFDIIILLFTWDGRSRR